MIIMISLLFLSAQGTAMEMTMSLSDLIMWESNDEYNDNDNMDNRIARKDRDTKSKMVLEEAVGGSGLGMFMTAVIGVGNEG